MPAASGSAAGSFLAGALFSTTSGVLAKCLTHVPSAAGLKQALL